MMAAKPNKQKQRMSTSGSASRIPTISVVEDMETHMAHVSKQIDNSVDKIIRDLDRHQFAIIDNFLGSDVCDRYRKESTAMYDGGHMVISQSTRWDEVTNTTVAYDKHNVYSMQLMGGELYYVGPRLHEYVVSIVRGLVPAINRKFPEASLSSTMASNKLAVCLGNGSRYDKHYDNSGADDLRKLTVLYYMNPNYIPSHGGEFRIYHPSAGYAEGNLSIPHTHSGVDSDGFSYTNVQPRSDRLFIFWSDRLVHSVLPSQAFSASDHRYALTVWIAATDSSAIAKEDDEITRHFSKGKGRILTT
jgi:2OG-Fe(II) oxygenase superfamily